MKTRVKNFGARRIRRAKTNRDSEKKISRNPDKKKFRVLPLATEKICQACREKKFWKQRESFRR